MAFGNRRGGFQQRRGGFQPRKPPINEGDEINVRIENVAEKGDGVAKVKGFVIFVPNTSEGQEVKIKVNRVLRNVGFGEVIGEADGPIEESAPAQSNDNRDQGPRGEDIPQAAAEPAPEDSEDFGEEAPAEETPAEEEAPEEVAEEPAAEEEAPEEEAPVEEEAPAEEAEEKQEE